MLEHEAYVFAAKENPLVGRQSAGIATEQFHLAGAGIEQAGDDGQQRGFAATARANNEGEFAEPGLEVDAAQRFDARAVTEVFVEVVAGDSDGIAVVHGSPPKHCCRLQHNDASDAQQTGDDDDKQDAAAGQRDALPH